MNVKIIKKYLPSNKMALVLADYQLAWESREASLLGRKEVFMGRAKFGIFGDGKEVAQLAMAKVFRKGDFRAGYYRDQTFMLAIGELTLQQYFAQLYAHADVDMEPASAGRLMTNHFATRMLDKNGEYQNLCQRKNSSSDISPTSGQMSRLLGLAYASKLFRENSALSSMTTFSNQGNEVAFGTIGDASTSEGVFFETINAAGVLQVPMLLSVWDDGYGISVSKKYQTTKENISKVLQGFQRTKKEDGIEIKVVKGWDYNKLCQVYEEAEKVCRQEHRPVLIHVVELTQPQGHSTSGSHERYKSKKRLAWEAEYDSLKKMKEWILDEGMSSLKDIDEIEKSAKIKVKKAKDAAWKAFNKDIHSSRHQLLKTLDKLSETYPEATKIKEKLDETSDSTRLDSIIAAKHALRVLRMENTEEKNNLLSWLKENIEKNGKRYSSHLYSQSSQSALQVPEVAATYTEVSPRLDGREILQACFDHALKRDPRIFALGEDVGKIGDVNQGFATLQKKYGEDRVTDTGIRENTIIGQGIGTALRGLRPIVEIQYLDYLLYALQPLSDDLASLHYRTRGGQKAPLIIRTRGHRLEGMWHSGSPMGMILHSLRGLYVLTPRNMTQAAGFYNTLLQSDDPALLIECLNGYRLKEVLPENIGSFTVPLGVPDIIREGSDVTVVTYGAMCRVVMEAANDLEQSGISCEVIDVQTLLPFDQYQKILHSVKKTNRVVFADEDVPGGASAYMMQEVVERQNAYHYLDAKPISITAKAHRPAYGSDGNYFSKPNAEDIFDRIYELMAKDDPHRFPSIYT